jgi:HD-GYP domain-containing protein (c-di-GMP phosphodiesterase class II)
MIYEKEMIIGNRLLDIFEGNNHLIFNDWLSSVKYVIKKQDDNDLNALTKLFKAIINNYIEYFKDGDMKSYCFSTMKVAEDIAFNDISYNNFLMAIECYQESYTHILIRNLDMDYLDKCLTVSNRLYYKTLAVIRDVYFDIKDTTLTAILKLSELRDDETGKHLERTKDYAILLSKELNLDFDFVKNMGKASLLHDVGKIAIRDNILLKPGKLNDYEFEEMKKHTIIGADAISKVISSNDLSHEYLYMAVDISLCHHEKYDGSGYPNGFKGAQIPLPARIFAIADAYDVITSKRPYKEPFSHEEAVRRIIFDSGKHFEPNIVDIFIKNQHKFKEINDRYNTLRQVKYEVECCYNI